MKPRLNEIADRKRAAGSEARPTIPHALSLSGSRPNGRLISEVVRSLEKNGWLLAAALVIATFVAYWPCRYGKWLWDDDFLLLSNPVLQPGGLAKVWVPGGYLDYWPLTYTVYWIQFHLWAFQSLGYHLVNIGFHALAAVLVWRVLSRLRVPGALFAAAIFALHPVNVESVAWIAQLKSVLSLVLALASVLWYLSYEQNGEHWWYWLALAAFVLSGLAKAEALTLPIVLLALAWWQRGRITRRDALRVLPYFLISACMAALVVWTQHALASANVRTDGIFSRAAVAGCAVLFYLGKLIWPVNLVPIYPRWKIPAQGMLWYLPGVALLVVLFVAWLKRRSWGRPVLMLIVCYLALLLPVLGFVNITYMKFSLVADRWQYVAMIVPCAMAAASAAILTGRFWRHPATRFGCVAVLLALSVMTWLQSKAYESPEIYYQTTLAGNPDCWLAENNYGLALAGHGQAAAAIAHYRRAIELNPGYSDAHGNLGAVLLDEGKLDSAVSQFKQALQLNPKLLLANYNLALAFGRQGEFDLAITHLNDELDIDSDFKLAHQTLVAAVSHREQLATALQRVREQLRKTPNDAEVLDDGAWILATSPYASIRNGDEAVRMAELAWKITGGDQPRALGTLAAAYAEAGRFDEAVVAAEKGARLAQASGNNRLAQQISTSLVVFRNGKPYRDLR